MGPVDLQWISPFPPLRSGIANYSQDFFGAIDGLWSVAAALESGSQPGHYQSIQDISFSAIDPDRPTFVHLGNSEFHDRGFEFAAKYPSVLVLHDTYLHHGRVGLAMRSGSMRGYWKELSDEYGDAGVIGGRELLAGRGDASIADFPMIESLARSSKAIIVHNQGAADEIQRRVPGARVYVVPMGIPLPAKVGKLEARAELGIDAGAFLIGSITHINPNKRIPVVLRALKRLIQDVPEALFVIAGTDSDSLQLSREIEAFGLRDHVLQLGYVDDRKARLLASALDACVNLRYPTAGETSASLLRLLGSGLPVLVTDSGASAELPDGVGLRVAVDPLEVDMVAALLREIAVNPGLSRDAGRAARSFVKEHHSMVQMIDGYRVVINSVYEVDLPELKEVPVEAAIQLKLNVQRAKAPGSSPATKIVSNAISELNLSGNGRAFQRVGLALVELGIHKPPGNLEGATSQRLRSRLACPRCGGVIGSDLTCQSCNELLASRNGWPDLNPTTSDTRT